MTSEGDLRHFNNFQMPSATSVISSHSEGPERRLPKAFSHTRHFNDIRRASVTFATSTTSEGDLRHVSMTSEGDLRHFNAIRTRPPSFQMTSEGHQRRLPKAFSDLRISMTFEDILRHFK